MSDVAAADLPLEFFALLRAIGARLVIVDCLPPGPGVFDDEAGGPGPWVAIEFADGYRYGWVHQDCIGALYDPEIILTYGGGQNALMRLATALAASESAIRDAADQLGGQAALDDERLSYEEIQVDRGWRGEWRNLPAVQASLAEPALYRPPGGAPDDDGDLIPLMRREKLTMTAPLSARQRAEEE